MDNQSGATRVRRDAADNRRALLEAARELFSAHGFEIPLEQIATVAGVSRATLYRNFATREELAAVIVEENLEQLEQRALALQGTHDGLERLLEFIFDLQVRTQALIPLLHRPEFGMLASLTQRTADAIRPVFDEAARQGILREGVILADVKRVIEMVSVTVRSPDIERRIAEQQRSWWILRRGLYTIDT